MFSFYFSAIGIDCFKCVSVNGTNPSCEDPFHNNYTSNLLERPCMGGRKGRNGLFPASACIKLAGKFGKSTKNTVFSFIYWEKRTLYCIDSFILSLFGLI